jgi:hypothetical protein
MAWTAPPTYVAGAILTAAQMNAISGNLNALTNGRRLGRVTRTTDLTVSATTLAGASDYFSSDLSWTAVAATEYLVQLSVARCVPGSSDYVTFNLVDGSGAGLCLLAVVGSQTGVLATFSYTPGAGTAAVNIRNVRGASNGTIYAANGGTGIFDYAPATLTVYGPMSTT